MDFLTFCGLGWLCWVLNSRLTLIADELAALTAAIEGEE